MPKTIKPVKSASNLKNLPTTSAANRRIFIEDINEPINTVICIPPDGGWGWIIVLGSFCCNFVTDAISYSFGMFIPEISKCLKAPKSEVAIVGSVLTGFMCICGPVVSAICNKYGFRMTACFGGIIASLSFIISSFCTNTKEMLFSLGILGGMGFSFVYIPTIVIIGFWFDRWRTLATSIAVTGSSVGMVLIPWVKTLLKDHDWRTKFRYLSCLILLCFFCPLLYREVPPTIIFGSDNVSYSVRGIKGSMVTTQTKDGKKCKCCRKLFSRHHNSMYPTATQSAGSLFAVYDTMSVASGTSRFPQFSNIFLTNPQSDLKHRLRCSRCCGCCCGQPNTIPSARPMYRDDIFFQNPLHQLPQYQRIMQSTAFLISHPRDLCIETIYFSISLHQLRQYQVIVGSTAGSVIDYHMSVTRVAAVKDYEEDNVCCLCTESVKRILATMLNVTILKSPSYLLLTTSGFFTFLGLLTPNMFIVDRALSNKIDYESAHYLLCTLGISNGVGRIVSGLLSIIPNVKALLITCLGLFIASITTMASAFLINKEWQFCYAGLYGMSVGCVTALRPIIIVELVGLEKLTNAFGISMMFQGLSCILGTALAGLFKDLSGDYYITFFFASGNIFLSAVMLLPLSAVSKWEKKKRSGSN